MVCVCVLFVDTRIKKGGNKTHTHTHKVRSLVGSKKTQNEWMNEFLNEWMNVIDRKKMMNEWIKWMNEIVLAYGFV